uniref:Uncharacterized protein n=1 Tax=Aegilops tauschii subsp. strangulata TaxID=200361 RepID=A0A453ESQ7_AEGTS
MFILRLGFQHILCWRKDTFRELMALASSARSFSSHSIKMSRQFRCSTGTGRTAACNEIIIHRSTHWEELANLESQGILISPKGISWRAHFDDIFPSNQSHDLQRHN